MRPKIICHMIGSIDGRLLSNRWTPVTEKAEPNTVLKVYDEAAQRLNTDGWIVGRKTMADLVSGTAHSHSTTDTSAPRTAYIGNRQNRPLAIAIDPSGKLHYGTDHIGDEHLVAIVSEQVANEYLAELREDGVSYLFAGTDGLDLEVAIATLGSSFGVETLLLEGGGTINGAFLKADLIDEISLLIYPGIDGLAGIPSIFEYHGTSADELPAMGRSLRMLCVETLAADILWVRYAVDRLPAP